MSDTKQEEDPGQPTSTPAPVPKKISWKKELELGYEEASATAAEPSADSNNNNCCCFKCGKAGAASRCSKCATVRYCSRECQVSDWKTGTGGGHKYSCKAYKRVGPTMTLTNVDDKRTAREDVLTRIRFYACSYAVHKAQTLGRGFLFLQSPSTLAELSLPFPKLPTGTMMEGTRSVLLHYLTMGEFDQEVCREDFEMATIRTELTEAVTNYEEQKDMVVVMRFRCGHVALGLAPLVPDFRVCKSVGKEYFEGGTEGALQLNLDDV